MNGRALEAIEGYFQETEHYAQKGRTPKGGYLYRFPVCDRFGLSNDHTYYYDGQRDFTEAAKARVKVEWVALQGILGDLPVGYVPGSITSGFRALQVIAKRNRHHDYAPDKRIRSTYKINQHISKDEMERDIIAPNVRDNLIRGHAAERLAKDLEPSMAVVPPVKREEAVRIMMADPAFSNGQRYEEEDFMALWNALVDQSRFMFLAEEGKFSRNTIWEWMRGTLIQAGVAPQRPKADIEMLDYDGKPVTLGWRAEKFAESVIYSLSIGVEPREAATALAWLFEIDDARRTGKKGAFERKSMHSILKNPAPDELAQMDALREKMLPILKNHCATYMDMTGLGRSWSFAQKAARKGDSAPFHPNQLPDWVREEAHAIEAAAEKQQNDLQLGLSGHAVQALVRRYNARKEPFGADRLASLFEEDVFARKTLAWERPALQFIAGASGIPTMPDNAIVLFYDFDGGQRALDEAKKRGCRVAELRTVMGGAAYEREIVEPNKAEAGRMVAAIKRHNPGRPVFSTLDTADLFDTIRNNRQFVAKEGPAALGSAAQFAFFREFIRMNAGSVMFPKGWEASNDSVHLRNYAHLIQAGLVERPMENPNALKVFTVNERGIKSAVPDTFAETLRPLADYVDWCLENRKEDREAYLGLARNLDLFERLDDPVYNHNLIAFDEADVTLTTLDYGALRNLRDRFAAPRQDRHGRYESTFMHEGLAHVPEERLRTSSGENRETGRTDLNPKYLDAQEKSLNRMRREAAQQPQTETMRIRNGGNDQRRLKFP